MITEGLKAYLRQNLRLVRNSKSRGLELKPTETIELWLEDECLTTIELN